MNYEINNNTQAIYPFGRNSSKIIEDEDNKLLEAFRKYQK